MDYAKLWFKEVIRARINELNQVYNGLMNISRIFTNLELEKYSKEISKLQTRVRSIIDKLNNEFLIKK